MNEMPAGLLDEQIRKEQCHEMSLPDTVRNPSRVAVGRYFTNVGLAQLWVMKNLGEADSDCVLEFRMKGLGKNRCILICTIICIITI